tara:strand:- start:1711 stop:2571 length:861 start_codon:yes stop_codon:yes gene_type:complete
MKSILNIDGFSIKKTINIKGNLIDLSNPIIMGILNLTPDSFYDGDLFNNKKKALLKVEKMIDEGAGIIDVGGCSTRPGAEIINEEEEWNRVRDVIKSIRKSFPNIIISIDTFRSTILKKSFDIGVDIINDVSGGSFDKKMFSVVGKLGLPYILMHSRGNPKSMTNLTSYDNLLEDITLYFAKKIELLQSNGVKDIIIDPGFGFAKTFDQNFTILNNLNYFTILDLPILVGISRKSFVQKKFNVSIEESLESSIKLNKIALENHASILRVHDVKETKIMLEEFLKNS